MNTRVDPSFVSRVGPEQAIPKYDNDTHGQPLGVRSIKSSGNDFCPTSCKCQNPSLVEPLYHYFLRQKIMGPEDPDTSFLPKTFE